MKALVAAAVCLVGIVALGLGGYEPWAVLTLEMGAAALALVLVFERLWLEESHASREASSARYAAWRRLPLLTRHPGLGRALSVATLGLARSRATNDDVELILPGSEGVEVRLDPSREGFILGVPFRRSGLFGPLALMTLWIGSSLLPISRVGLAVLSPRAHEARLRAEALAGVEAAPASPTSLVPFLTARDLWIWLAVLALFAVTFSLVRRDPRNAFRLALAVTVLGAVSGLYGVMGWLDTIAEAFGIASTSMRARGSFGNANHYAMFQGISVLVGLGWAGAMWRRAHAGPSRGRRGPRGDDAGRVWIGAVMLVSAALGLVLSLSRSGIAFTLIAAVAFVFLGSVPRARRGSAVPLAAVGLAVVALLVWLGIEPLVARFGDIAEQMDQEGTRVVMWRDSLAGVWDFWLTGAGLASFRYVGTFYRGLPGNFYYSWAHNDYLQLAIELGLPGIILLAVILAAGLRAVSRARTWLARGDDAAGSVLHAGFVSALLYVACHSVTDFGLHLPANFALLALVAAAAVGMGAEAETQAAEAATESHPSEDAVESGSRRARAWRSSPR